MLPDAKLLAFYRHWLSVFANGVTKLEEARLATISERRLRQRMEELYQRGKFAALHQLVFSPEANLLRRRVETLGDILAVQEQNRRHIFAINCGANSYFRRPSDRRVFQPDLPYSPSRRAGYIGNYRSVVRRIPVENPCCCDRQGAGDQISGGGKHPVQPPSLQCGGNCSGLVSACNLVLPAKLWYIIRRDGIGKTRSGLDGGGDEDC
ncbi:MAG: hypothetical protein PHS41_03115 [Victivallaceae bacterium]|nr:hypothetical protein [Victivallaceae bacterium]